MGPRIGPLAEKPYCLRSATTVSAAPSICGTTRCESLNETQGREYSALRVR